MTTLVPRVIGDAPTRLQSLSPKELVNEAALSDDWLVRQLAAIIETANARGIEYMVFA